MQKLSTYYFKSLAPEVIWEYGAISKPLSENLDFDKPFRVLVPHHLLKSFKLEYPEITKQAKIKTFDRNYFKKGDKKIDRFMIDVFEVE